MTPDDRARVAELARAGYTRRAIADQLALCVGCVAAVLRAARPTRATPAAPKVRAPGPAVSKTRVPTPAEIADIAARYRRGDGITRIVAELRCGVAFVVRCLDAAGVARRPSHPRLPGDVRADLLARWAAGEPSAALAARVGMSVEQLRRTLRRYGAPPRTPGRARHPLRETARRLAEDGVPLAHIARTLSLSIPTVHEWKRRDRWVVPVARGSAHPRYAEAVARVQAGASCHAVARDLGIAASTVRGWLVAAPRPRRRSAPAAARVRTLPRVRCACGRLHDAAACTCGTPHPLAEAA